MNTKEINQIINVLSNHFAKSGISIEFPNWQTYLNKLDAMQKHVKIYLDYHGYSIADFIPCESCGAKAVDIHHLIFRSQGGKDEIKNLVAVCRSCHTKAHNNREFNEKLKK